MALIAALLMGGTVSLIPKLIALRCEGYEYLSVSEFRQMIAEASEDEEDLLNRFMSYDDGPLMAMRYVVEDCSFLMGTLLPLYDGHYRNDGIYRLPTYYFKPTDNYYYAVDPHPSFDCESLDSENLTVRAYQEAVEEFL